MEGSHPRFRENTSTSRMPSQKIGVARPMLEITVTTLSIHVPRFTAVTAPNSTPSTTDTMEEITPRYMVVGSLAATSSDTGLR